MRSHKSSLPRFLWIDSPMFRTIFIAAFCIVTANAPLPCQAESTRPHSPLQRCGTNAPFVNGIQIKSLNTQLASAKTKFKKILPWFPEYQQAQNRVAECVEAIEAARDSQDSQQLDLAIQGKTAAEKQLAAIAERLETKDAGIAAIRAKLDYYLDRRKVLVKEAEARRDKRDAEPQLQRKWTSTVEAIFYLVL